MGMHGLGQHIHGWENMRYHQHACKRVYRGWQPVSRSPSMLANRPTADMNEPTDAQLQACRPQRWTTHAHGCSHITKARSAKPWHESNLPNLEVVTAGTAKCQVPPVRREHPCAPMRPCSTCMYMCVGRAADQRAANRWWFDAGSTALR